MCRDKSEVAAGNGCPFPTFLRPSSSASQPEPQVAARAAAVLGFRTWESVTDFGFA